MKFRISPALVVVVAGLALWEAAGLWSDLVRNVTGTPITVGGELAEIFTSSDFIFHFGITALELAAGL